ncbi:MAG: hypothetical protein JO236_10335 [Mycobacterium sp.]|uniref:hypothetical protein n=1 Tax=Mycobacterium sp. TaxID=1785 RepID=UPI001ED55368|nr:hypothetical protein [Mycobacterium sp.]MBW0017926.1 hypothetical protein [Mycobacterium sp.]
MDKRDTASRFDWQSRFGWATVFFALALGLHAADHIRRGMEASPPAVVAAGNAQILAAVITVILVILRNRWAPHAAVVVGIASAVGFSAAHLLPTWGPFSDTFVNPAPAAGVTWFSWVTAVVEIVADLVFAAVGLAVLSHRRARA